MPSHEESTGSTVHMGLECAIFVVHKSAIVQMKFLIPHTHFEIVCGERHVHRKCMEKHVFSLLEVLLKHIVYCYNYAQHCAQCAGV